MKRSLVAGVALCAALYSVPSYATVIVWANPPVLAPFAGFPQVSANATSSETGTPIDTAYAFQFAPTAGSGTIQESLTIGDIRQSFAPGAFDLYTADSSGNPLTLIETSTPVFINSQWFAALTPVVEQSGYFAAVLTGTLNTSVSGGPVSPVVSITAIAAGPGGIPEASTWAMMLAGFAGLGFAGYRARRSAAAIA